MGNKAWAETLLWIEGEELAETREPTGRRKYVKARRKQSGGGHMWQDSNMWAQLLETGWVPMSCSEVYCGFWPFGAWKRQWLFVREATAETPEAFVEVELD